MKNKNYQIGWWTTDMCNLIYKDICSYNMKTDVSLIIDRPINISFRSFNSLSIKRNYE